MRKLNLIMLLLALTGCGRKTTEMPIEPAETPSPVVIPTAPPVAKSTTYNYLALGDSYTIGQSVDSKDSFPFQLVAKLRAENLDVTNPPTIIARTGWTTTNLISAINDAGIMNNKYDFVTLLIGVNNQYQGQSQTNYRTEFVQLLNTAVAFAKGNNKRVFVLSIPDYSVTPYAGGSDRKKIATELDQFNAINLEESQKAGVNYVSITEISRKAANDTSLLAYDGLHPSGTMYAQWVATFVGDVIKSLQ